MATVVFPIEDILSITTGRLLCKMEAVYDILNFMTGDDLYTHQLPRAQDVCAPAILFQHPQLKQAEAHAKNVDQDNWREFVNLARTWFGDALPLVPLAEWKHRDAMQEAIDMMGEDRVIGILPDATDEDIERAVRDIKRRMKGRR